LNDLQTVIAVTYDNLAKYINKILGYLKDFELIQHVIHTAARVLKDLKALQVASVADGLQTHTQTHTHTGDRVK